VVRGLATKTFRLGKPPGKVWEVGTGGVAGGRVKGDNKSRNGSTLMEGSGTNQQKQSAEVPMGSG